MKLTLFASAIFALLAFQPTAPAAAVSNATPVVTRYFVVDLTNLSGDGWHSVPLDTGVPSMPWQNNALLAVHWSLRAAIGSGGATDVVIHVALAPQGHPGGPPALIFGSELAQVAPDAPQVRDGTETFSTPLDLNAFFTGGQFQGQPLEGQAEVEAGGGGSVQDVRIVITTLSTA